MGAPEGIHLPCPTLLCSDHFFDQAMDGRVNRLATPWSLEMNLEMKHYVYALDAGRKKITAAGRK